jgi:hypothetical protein
VLGQLRELYVLASLLAVPVEVPVEVGAVLVAALTALAALLVAALAVLSHWQWPSLEERKRRPSVVVDFSCSCCLIASSRLLSSSLTLYYRQYTRG